MIISERWCEECKTFHNELIFGVEHSEFKKQKDKDESLSIERLPPRPF